MLYRSMEEAGAVLRRPVVAIGNFDGVHRGHAALIREAVAEAEARDVEAAVLTFEPHPVLYFRPDTPDFRLTTLEQKARLLTELGAHAVVAAPFDAELASSSPTEFVDRVLVGALKASVVLVGDDFRFGKGRTGDATMLREIGAERGIEVRTVDVVCHGEAISSTRVRKALDAGDLATVAALLGRPYAVVGTVRHGDGIGRGFGFPTANVETTNSLLPPDGIYASRLRDERWGKLDSATYVGTRPAVGGTARVVEAYCIEAAGDLDLYDHEVELEFVARVREDRHFASTDALIAQMHVDIEDVRRALASRQNS